MLDPGQNPLEKILSIKASSAYILLSWPYGIWHHPAKPDLFHDVPVRKITAYL
jgi:hypothetical protein